MPFMTQVISASPLAINWPSGTESKVRQDLFSFSTPKRVEKRKEDVSGVHAGAVSATFFSSWAAPPASNQSVVSLIGRLFSIGIFPLNLEYSDALCNSPEAFSYLLSMSDAWFIVVGDYDDVAL